MITAICSGVWIFWGLMVMKSKAGVATRVDVNRHTQMYAPKMDGKLDSYTVPSYGKKKKKKKKKTRGPTVL